VEGNGSDAYTDVLRHGDLVIGAGACGESSYDARLDLCADAPRGAVTSSCDGDSGGPLVAAGRLVGVVSFGPADCRAESYFARVSAERAFIAAAVAGTVLPAPAEPAPRLSKAAAKAALPAILRHRYGARFTHRRTYAAVCARRSRSTVVCGVAWTTGRQRWRGTVTLSLRGDPGGGRTLGSRVEVRRFRRTAGA
jgi:hypothetical protein